MEKKKKDLEKAQSDVGLIRILGKDIRGDMKLGVALTKIKGISWSFSNGVCRALGLEQSQKIQDIKKEDTLRIEKFVENPETPAFLKNRRKDFDDGSDKHLVGADLRLRNEFDVKRLKKIKSYRGVRHSANLPVRGQRTKAHFRRNRKPSVAAAKKKKRKEGEK